MKFIVFVFSLVLFLKGVVGQDESKSAYPKYRFTFNTGDEGGHYRKEESDAEGHVTGMYQYVDPNGNLRIVRYKSEPEVGYQAFGDVGVYPKPHLAKSSTPGSKFNMYYLRPSVSQAKDTIAERRIEDVQEFSKAFQEAQKYTTLPKVERDNHLAKDISPTQSSFVSTLAVEHALPTTEDRLPVAATNLPEESTSTPAATETISIPPFVETSESSNKVENVLQMQSQKAVPLPGTDSPQVRETLNTSFLENNSLTDLKLPSDHRSPLVLPLRFNSDPKFLPYFYVYPNSFTYNGLPHTYPLLL